MKKITFKTLGCRLNQFETDALASQFQKNGYTVVDFNENADVVVVNTCTVTDQSDQKSSQMIRQAARKHQGAMLVVTGCMVNNHKQTLESNPDNLIWFVENEQKSSIFSLVDGHFKGEIIHPERSDQNLFNYQAAENTFHTRSWIKIQDGCDNFCTFCIIPKVRGRATSRLCEDVLENIRQVVGFGFKEIVLTGVNIGRYKAGDVDFEMLVEKILELPGDFRLRIGSIEPEGFGDRLLDLFAHPKLTPHLHLCLQSGSDNILSKMRRMYTVGGFMDIVNKTKNRYPDFNFTTDVIVGFPDETEEDFNQTLDVCKQIGFGHIHTFKYSVRKGTRAERMSEQIPEAMKTARSEMIRNLAEELKRNYRSSLIGKEQTLLIEKSKSGIAQGYGENYVPVKIRGKNIPINEFVKARLVSLNEGDEPSFLGELIV
ncbi:MAG: tRNA (N(6)-L-threonylcarbamoyladenosine(37)-C(2))-methylthiotransferase MtaB [Bacteroidales bacterium]|nr:tRNA (N(6)-L-threonylcarbamoyladenosine(37)-C(2))-methylthiotransferase MtaB [Bacteroidales bacterium]